MPKYHNKKVELYGTVFDSKGEGKRYLYLLSELRSGNISDLKLQVPYLLQEKFVDAEGKKVREINYIVDFEYIKDGKKYVEDFKGMRTKEYIIKSKLFRYKYRDIIFREVKA